LRTLEDIVLLEKDEDIYKVLNHFRPTSRWHEPLPEVRLSEQFKSKLRPYRYKRGLVEDVYPKYSESYLPQVVKGIILDEWSFLKDRSSLIMSSKKFAQHMRRWGVATVDAANQVYDFKHELLLPTRGPRFLLGVLVAIGGVVALGTVVTAGGIALALLDP
jgi:hypothetical protein